MRSAFFSFSLLIICSFPVAQDRPNILWFVSEDNGPYLGCYGDTLARTPALDAFAARSVRYVNAFANAPVCAPSRSTLITGVLPTSLGSQHMRSNVRVGESIRFFPRYLRDAGYYTSLRLKRDYNIPGQPGTWDVDDWWNFSEALPARKTDQPFFVFYNTWMTHEGKLHNYRDSKMDYFRNTFERLSPDSLAALESRLVSIDPASVTPPPYLPDLPEVRADLAVYYELMQLMDMEFASVVTDLERMGLADNTIVIYTSDHGGVLGRSKRFPLESGLRVPMIVHFPEKYRHLAPSAPGTATDRIVSFLDFAPTLLKLAGVEPPGHFQGTDFLGEEEAEYAFGFRGRMDESYDMVRTLRNKRYRYVRHFMPHRPFGQRVNYLWKAGNVTAWERAFRAGATNPVQSAFWLPKAAEALYDCASDPHNVRNLAADSKYVGVLLRMRRDLHERMLDRKDTGLIPESELFTAWERDSIRYADYAAAQPLDRILEAAERATSGSASRKEIARWLKDDQAAVRYWGAIAACLYPTDQSLRETALSAAAVSDESPAVRVAAAEALFRRGDAWKSTKIFFSLLAHDNPYVVLMVANALEATGATSPEIKSRLAEIAERDPKGRFAYAVRKCGYLLTL